jgi:hypothetical protein
MQTDRVEELKAAGPNGREELKVARTKQSWRDRGGMQEAGMVGSTGWEIIEVLGGTGGRPTRIAPWRLKLGLRGEWLVYD